MIYRDTDATTKTDEAENVFHKNDLFDTPYSTRQNDAIECQIKILHNIRVTEKIYFNGPTAMTIFHGMCVYRDIMGGANGNVLVPS